MRAVLSGCMVVVSVCSLVMKCDVEIRSSLTTDEQPQLCLHGGRGGGGGVNLNLFCFGAVFVNGLYF